MIFVLVDDDIVPSTITVPAVKLPFTWQDTHVTAVSLKYPYTSAVAPSVVPADPAIQVTSVIIYELVNSPDFEVTN